MPKNIRWTRFVPVLSMITVSACVPGAGIVALVFSSFPQYIISLSFILEHRILDTFNVMAVIMSLFQLLSSPLLTGSSAFFKMQKLDEDDEKNNQRVHIVKAHAFVEKQEKEEGELSTKDMSYLWILTAIAYLFLFLPILLLEIIHFCPVLFEYYYYMNMSTTNLIIYLLTFNVPKLLFLMMQAMTPQKWEGNQTLLTAKNPEALKTKIENDMKHKDLATTDFNVVQIAGVVAKDELNKSKTKLVRFKGVMMLVVMGIVYILLFLVLPLIPAVLYCLSFPILLLQDFMSFKVIEEKTHFKLTTDLP
eukprot:155726_1